ncbi:thioredoxin O1, mitochondrial [Cicer arietinum]|uniref:thioredoxin O1, mitochondrial n=1 Tax=Cicer arietinum TaxID=3827 RepID=UPI003CC6B967
MGGTRNLIVRSLAFRHAIKNTVRPLLKIHSKISKSSLFAATIASSTFSSHLSFHNNSRSLCSASGSPGVILVNSEEEFNNILNKVQGRFISPIVGELSNKYPHVTTYKIDIDQEAIRDTLSRLQITSVPTLHFFQNGRKTDELVGADVARLNHITEKLFK